MQLTRRQSAGTFAVMLLVLLVVAGVALPLVYGPGMKFACGPLGTAANALLAVIAVVAVRLVLVRWRKQDAGLHFSPLPILLGVVWGAAMAALIVGVGVALGAWKVSAIPAAEQPAAAEVALALLAFGFSSVFQEAFLQSGLFSALRSGFPLGVALVAPNVIFALLHVDEHSTVLGQLNIALFGAAMAVLFIRGRGKTPSLALPIGFHTGWNTTFALAFGVTLAGSESPWRWMRFEAQDRLLSGGAGYGPEGSLPATVILALIIAVGLLRRRAR